MVDPEIVGARLLRLEACLRKLDAARTAGHAAFLQDEAVQDAAERNLQVALQVCLDLGAHIVADRAYRAPRGYASIFVTLGREGVIAEARAARLALAAGLRNILVHDYLEVDPEKVWRALDGLDDLRAFARAVERLG